MSESPPEEIAGLETQIVEHPDRLDLYKSYGDHLLSQGDLRGHLIAAQLELARLRMLKKTEESLSAQCRELVLGPLHAYSQQVSVTTKLGFLDSVAFDLDSRELSRVKVVGLLTKLVKHSSAQFVSALAFRCSPVRWLSTSECLATIVEMLTTFGQPQSLRRLDLGAPLTSPQLAGDFYPEDDMNRFYWSRFRQSFGFFETSGSLDSIADLDLLWQVFPRLESIRIGIPAAVGDMQWSRVKSLALLCCYDHHLDSLSTAQCPALERLMLGFVAETPCPDDLVTALSQLGHGCPQLRSLTLVNPSVMACIQLLRSSLVDQLTSIAVRADRDEGPRIGQHILEQPERLSGLERFKLVTTLPPDMAQALSSSPVNVDLTGCSLSEPKTASTEDITGSGQDPADTAATRDSNEFHCSFCHKLRREVRHLILGARDLAICDECVGLCGYIIEEEIEPEGASGPSPQVDRREFEDDDGATSIGVRHRRG